MVILNWIGIHWLDLLQSIAIIAGLYFTTRSFITDTEVRRVQHQFSVTKQHREIWSLLFDRPELKRILELEPDLTRTPITQEEELFVTFLIFHLSNSFQAIKAGVFIKPEGLSKDIAGFFKKPIPYTVWDRSRKLLDEEFVAFVEGMAGKKY